MTDAYAIVYEGGDGGNWSGYFLNGPPVYSTGDTCAEVTRRMAEGLEALRELEAEERAKAQEAEGAATR